MRGRVYMLPDYRPHNPYQQLLADALARRDIEVHFPSGYRRGLPIRRGLTTDLGRPHDAVLHLHWPEAYLRGTSGGISRLRMHKLWLDLALSRREVRKVVWTIHNLASHESDSRRPGELALYRRLARLSDALIVHSEAARSPVSEALQVSPERLHVIAQANYNEVYGPPVKRDEARAQLGLPGDAKVFLHLGMLRPYKGLEGLLETWRAHAPENATLLIAGAALDPTYAAHLRALVDGTGNVLLHEGFVPYARVSTYLGAADVAVLPFANILNSGSLELALGYGVPVVAPDLPAIRETVGPEYPLLYGPEKPVDLVHAMQRAANMDLAPLTAQLRERSARWSWDDVAAATAATYA